MSTSGIVIHYIGGVVVDPLTPRKYIAVSGNSVFSVYGVFQEHIPVTKWDLPVYTDSDKNSFWYHKSLGFNCPLFWWNSTQAIKDGLVMRSSHRGDIMVHNKNYELVLLSLEEIQYLEAYDFLKGNMTCRTPL
jgi:hypothetical protein